MTMVKMQYLQVLLMSRQPLTKLNCVHRWRKKAEGVLTVNVTLPPCLAVGV